MSTARLRSLRLVGFKSFAERTQVEFGPGISAVVGPNGSGKSNLADALRWVLGEQGRSLRTRRAEDLIYAGSSTRRAQGMSDVTLVLDNEDGLLPVPYAEVELGRRLFRNGENEFLVNRQRVRLRDLVDLLDEANLADNAFLFIGQGMVDQALALRPEERRPLFEEAAGIRKHERRRRAAENELAQAEANLERVRDLVDELRPQARRLAAQAEQQRERLSAGSELADALVASGRARLGGAARELRAGDRRLERERAAADTALLGLRDAEGAIATATAELTSRQEQERARRAELDAARARLTELRLEESRTLSDAAAHERELAGIETDREATHQRMTAARLELAAALPEPDLAAETALEDATTRLRDGERQARELRETGRAAEERTQLARDARAAQEAALARAVSRATAAQAALADHVARTEGAATSLRAALDAAEQATIEAERAAEAEQAADAASVHAREAQRAADDRASAIAGQVAAARGALDAATASLTALRRRLGSADVTSAVRIRRLDDGLEVEPSLRQAVAVALGEALTAAVVDPATVLETGDTTTGSWVLDGIGSAAVRERERQEVLGLATDRGGGALATAVLRDASGQAARLLARSVWVPDLAAALELAGRLPAGWQVVTPSGSLLSDVGLVRVGIQQDALELRARVSEAERAEAAAAAESATLEEGSRTAREAASAARTAADEARIALDAARRDRRQVDERARATTRAADAAQREGSWAEAQAARLRQEAETAEAELRTREAEAAAWTAAPEEASQDDDWARQLAALDARLEALRAERDRHAAAATAGRRARDEALERRRRAEVRLAMDETHIQELDARSERAVAARSDRATVLARAREQLAAAVEQESRLAASLAAIEATSGDERARLVAAEASASEAREAVRRTETATRAAEVAVMAARLQLDAGREALLVELAGIGADGLAALQRAAGLPEVVADDAPLPEDAALPDESALPGDAPLPADVPLPADAPDTDATEDATPIDASADALAQALEHGLDVALARWADEADDTIPGISPARLSTLRRRYHELGAGNPFAERELAEVRERLDGLESQHADLETAIRETRALIARLETLISEQFRRTFAELEGAFARRFEQLFGGGEASLLLTSPEDLGATGVEITARPPGKRRQPLAMLSGGERALTAVALLLAMLEVHPVPFCVLDEVDAALDEANVGRFAAALRGLSEHIQFVVITHNRGTIETADALYGVTTGDDAVSRVVSLRLADLPPAGSEDGAFAGAIR